MPSISESDDGRKHDAITRTQRVEPKYLKIVESLRANIKAGHYRNGGRLPSEAELVRRFSVSRMTAVKALQYLQKEGLLVRRTGSGTYVSENPLGENSVFGLIIPDLGQTEIFEPICKGMAGSPRGAGKPSTWSLSWGQSTPAGIDREDAAVQLCQQYIDQKVSGVFFAPLEFAPHRDQVNRRVLKSLKSARVPVVLLDRRVSDFPSQCEYDLVGIDNRRAGYIMTQHLLRQGAKRVAFLAIAGSAETVEDRITGYREALFAHGIGRSNDRVIRAHPTDAAAISAALTNLGIDAILCANDNTAAQLMHTLMGLGLRIPEDIRIAGIDDVRYASLLPVPLTTLHQPCLDIGAAAVAAMLDRIANPHLAPRSILLNGHLVVRRSCGAAVASC
jgi:DNA-binding LacI/PurR family transcriptional regulator